MPKRNNKEKMAFDDWFVMNYSRLKESIGLMSVFDDDAFHEAYLTIVTSKSLPATASGYHKIFLTTYRQISRHNLNESYTISHPDDRFFTLLSDTVEEEEPKRDRAGLVRSICTFIRSTFSTAQLSVWEMRMQGYSIRDTADCLNLKERQVKEYESIVSCQTRKQFAFAI